MLGTAELETIIHDNKLPAVIEETGPTGFGQATRKPPCRKRCPLDCPLSRA
jgi:hypothetical protein